MTVEEKQKSSPPGQAAQPGKGKKESVSILVIIRKIWAWVFLAVLVIVFSIASKQANDVNFISLRSVQGILTYATQILLVGLAETLIIIVAGIDLSAGWVLGYSAVVGATVMQALYPKGFSPVIVITAGMLSGILVAIIPGVVNGILIAKVKVPAFISTLGMGVLIEGVALLISGGYPVVKQPAYLGMIGNSSILYYWPGHGVSFFKYPELATQADIPNILVIMPTVVLVTIIVTAVVWFILAKTQFGQHLYAIGGNMEGAIRAGIQVKSTLIKVYTLAAVLAGIAGVLWSTRFSSGAYNAGETTTMNAIAAVVIGGASLYGGEGTIIGTVVGALILATIQYGLVLLGVVPFYQFIAVGIVVIVAVIVDQFGRALGK
jgi:ribose/xylose/arabinose/galactoside ABC-type transport system permease subunit